VSTIKCTQEYINGKKGMDNNIKVTIDQLYEYLKSLNENEEPNTDKINLDFTKLFLLFCSAIFVTLFKTRFIEPKFIRFNTGWIYNYSRVCLGIFKGYYHLSIKYIFKI
jgi:hypothetical protein